MAYFSGEFDVARLTTLASLAKDHRTVEHAGRTVHIWRDVCPVRGERTVHAAFAREGLIVMSEGLETLKDAIDALDGSSAGVDLSDRVDAEAFFTVVALDLHKLPPREPGALMLSYVTDLEYSVKAGYSPYGMVETHTVLMSLHDREPGVIEQMFASHPMSRERLATAERKVAALSQEIRNRPLRKEAYQRYAGEVIARRPAWDMTREAQGLLANDQEREAEARLGDAVRMAPDEGVIRTFHAIALGEMEQWGAAADQARRGAQLASDVFVSRAAAGEILLESDAAASLENLVAAEDLLPGVPSVALMQGLALEKLRRRNDAVQAYREAYRRDPEGDVGARAVQRLRALGVV